MEAVLSNWDQNGGKQSHGAQDKSENKTKNELVSLSVVVSNVL